MALRLLSFLSALSFSFGFIGKCVTNGGFGLQSKMGPLRINEISIRNYVSVLKMEPKDEEEVVYLTDSDSQFASKMKGIASPGDFAQYLKSVAQKRVSLSRSDRRQLADEMQHRIPLMSVHSACDVIWSLGTLKLPIKNMDNVPVVTDMLLAKLDAFQNAMTSEDMALALMGLARQGIRSPSTAAPSGSFLEALPRTLLSMDSIQVANCMWALGKYGILWDSLSSKVQKIYEAAIVRVGPKMSPLAAANTIHGLSNQRVKWSALPAYFTEALSRVLENNIKEMNEQEVSNSISGLGRLGAEWNDLSPTIRRSLGDAFLGTIGGGDLPPRGLAMTVHGLGRMNADFTSLPSNFRTSLMAAIHKISPKVNSLEVSNILYGLGKMGISFSIDEVNMGKEAAANAAISISPKTVPFTIPGLAMKGVSSEELDLSIAGRSRGSTPALKGSPGRGFKADCAVTTGMSRKARESLLDAFSREALQMTAQGVANSLWGLMLMDAHWWILSPNLQDIVLKLVEREVGRMTEQELCNAIYALGRLGVRWSDLPFDTQMSVLLAVEEISIVMAPAGVVMTLLGFGRMSLTWDNMSVTLVSALSDSIERVLQSASERTLSGLVHALATVGAQWSDLSPELQQAVLAGISKGDITNQQMNTSKDAARKSHNVPRSQTVAPKIMTHPVLKSGRSPERASRAAFGASAILTIETIRNLMPTPNVQKTPPSTANSWSKSKPTDPLSKSLSTNSLLSQKSSRAAAALLLSPSSPLGPTALVAIQTMISPPNLDMHGFKALIKSQLASPIVETAQSPHTQAPKRMPSQPVAANELEFYKLVASTPKTSAPTSPKLKGMSAIGVSSRGKGKVELSKAEKKKQKMIEIRDKKNIDGAIKKKRVPVVKTVVVARSKGGGSMGDLKPKSSITISEAVSSASSGSSSGVAGNHLVYSLGQMGVSWTQLGDETRATLSDSLVQSLPQMGEMGVVNSLHGLTSLGAKWSDLGADVQSSFQIALRRVSPQMGQQGVSVTILSLAKMDVIWVDELDECTRLALKKAVASQSHIGEHALSSLLYGLGKLSRTWSGLPPDVQQTLKEAIVLCHLNDRCTPQGVANTLHGLAQMQATWDVLSSSVKLALCAEASKAVLTATETQLSNILGSLGKMGLQWEAFPDQLKGRVVAALTAKAATFSEWHLSTLLFSLGSMGLGWTSLPNPLRDAFTLALQRVNTVREQLTAPQQNIKDNLSVDDSQKDQKNWKPKSIALDDYDELLTVVDYVIRKEEKGAQRTRNNNGNNRSAGNIEKLLQMNAQGVSMTIVGMSRLAATYGLLPDSLVKSLSTSLQNALPSMNPVQVAVSISGLSKAQWRWDSLSANLKEELLAAITRTACKASSLDMALLMNGLGTMGARWSNLSTGTRLSLQVGIKRTAIRAVADEVAGVTFGLAMMEVSWNVLPLDLKKSLKIGILRICGAKVQVASPSASTGIAGATQLTATSKISPSSTRSRGNSGSETSSGGQQSITPIQVMSPQALANLMYATSLLVFEESAEVHEELTPVHIALLDSLSLIGVGGSQFTEAEKEQILIYISTLQTLTPLGNSVTSRPKCILRADKPFSKPSKLQQTVVSALTAALSRKTADFEVEDEYSAFSGAFPVDATIFEGDKPVAFVEVNGPQHYREDGGLRRKDLMKEALYRGKYPDASFTRVRFDQVSRLGSGYVGFQVAQFISNSPPVRVRCTAAAGVCTSFFPLFSPSTSPDACTVVYQDCEEDGLAARRAERELAKALSLEGGGTLSPMYNNVHSHAFYISQYLNT